MLGVGSTCRRNHKITHSSQLRLYFDGRTNKHQSVCRQCTAFLAANPGLKRTRGTLEVGMKCARNHVIRTKAELYLTNRSKDGMEYFSCARCRALYQATWRTNKKIKGPDRDVRRYVELTCGHEVLFDTPVPRRGEPIWCERCEYFDSVREWGRVAPRTAPSVHPLAPERECSSLREQDGDDQRVYTMED